MFLKAAALSLLALFGWRHEPTETTHYAVRDQYPLPGTGRWNSVAVDPIDRRVFLSRGDRVQVMDTHGHLVGTIAGLEDPHGVIAVRELGRGFVTNSRTDSITEFDLRTLRRLRTIPVTGHFPAEILYDPSTRDLFVFNVRSDDASVVNPVSGKEIAKIRFKGIPELAAADGRGRVYVNIENQEQVVALDASSLKIADVWDLPNCLSPTGLALDDANERVFSTCQNGVLLVTEAYGGGVVARIPIGKEADGTVFDPASHNIFVPSGSAGTLTVIHEESANKYRVAQTVITERGAHTLALDPVEHRIYLPTARLGTLDDPSKPPPMAEGSFHVLAVW